MEKKSKCLYKIPKIQIGSPLLLEHLPLCDVEWDFGESLQKILRIAERRRYASLWRVLARGKDKGNRWGSNVNIYQPLLGVFVFSFQSSVQLTEATVFGLCEKNLQILTLQLERLSHVDFMTWMSHVWYTTGFEWRMDSVHVTLGYGTSDSRYEEQQWLKKGLKSELDTRSEKYVRGRPQTRLDGQRECFFRRPNNP